MNQFGIEQVQKAASEISRQEWDLIISSPLGRAKQSAAIIAAQLGVAEVTETPLLLERAFGIGEGMLYDEWSAKFAHLDEIPGAESASQVTLRAEQLLEHVQSEFAGRRILAVSHGALIRFVLQVVTAGEVPPKGERLENASLNVIRRLQSWQLDQWAPKPLGS